MEVEFAGASWQTLQLEVACPEADEAEIVPVAIGIADSRLDAALPATVVAAADEAHAFIAAIEVTAPPTQAGPPGRRRRG